jgi:hypothetical protein
VRYLSGCVPQSTDVRARMRAMNIGVMQTPDTGYSPETVGSFPCWAADNGCFSARWQAPKWLAFLESFTHVPNCLFAVVPDIVGDAEATRARWDEWAPTVRALGYPVAYVLQDGEDGRTIPTDADWLFIGGSTAYKLSDQVRRIVAATDLPVHMGRVNSGRRLQLCAAWGVESADGTFLAFGADRNIGRLEGFMRRAAHPRLAGV